MNNFIATITAGKSFASLCRSKWSFLESLSAGFIFADEYSWNWRSNRLTIEIMRESSFYYVHFLQRWKWLTCTNSASCSRSRTDLIFESQLRLWRLRRTRIPIFVSSECRRFCAAWIAFDSIPFHLFVWVFSVFFTFWISSSVSIECDLNPWRK